MRKWLHTGVIAGATILATSLAAMAVAAPALADTPVTTASATQGTIIVNSDGTRTLTVQGTWQWPSITSDCNLTKAGAGYAVDWNDPSQAGNALTTIGSVAITAGTQTANALNPADDLVHATPPGQDSTSTSVWRSGCGTFINPPGYNSGTWGPISHTYPASFTGAITVCPIFYDVHGTAGGAPSSTTQITAGGSSRNTDNAVDESSQCPASTFKSQPAISATPPAATAAGSPVHATAHLTGASAPGGSMTFTVYGPADASCSGPVAFSGTSTVNGDGDYTSPAFTPSQAGDYQWVAGYSGDSANLPADSQCAQASEHVDTAPATAGDPTPTPAATAPAPSSLQPAPLPADLRNLTAPGPPSLTVLSPTLAPALGKTVALAATSGSVTVQLPGSHQLVPLGAATRLPVGTVVDTRHGVIDLATARDATGTPQVASVTGGEFQVRQSPYSGLTSLALHGGSFAQTCRSTSLPAPGHAAAASTNHSRSRVVRWLWSTDNHGRFSTRGQNSIATVRGTSWITVDRCDGTFTWVVRGQVVVHDTEQHRSVVVNAGHGYLAAP